MCNIYIYKLISLIFNISFSILGVRFFLSATDAPRAMDYGVLQLGDPFVSLSGQEVVGPYSKYTFACTSLATTKPITLFSHQLHMHATGARMVTQHFREGVQIGGAEIEHYDFDYQDVTYRGEVAQPGDSFTTTCFYDTNKAKNTGRKTVFGLGESFSAIACSDPRVAAGVERTCVERPALGEPRGATFVHGATPVERPLL